MAVKPVLKMGHPLLTQISKPVDDPTDDSIKSLVEDMFDTMHACEGAGLAAPQIGVLSRVVIFGFESNERYPDAESVPVTVLINPTIKILTTATATDWEGCLSVPGMRGRVTRPTEIHYSGYDLDGNWFERHANDFHARVVMHECDHLDGILYPFKLNDMADFGFIDALQEAGKYTPVACDSE
jgi:peptide deformylase